MILGFSSKFPNGKPTLFWQKLRAGQLIGAEPGKIMFMPGRGQEHWECDYRVKPKLHTIRHDRAGRWRAGRSVQGYYAARTKKMRKIFEATCYSVQFIEIKYEQGKLNPPCVYIETTKDNWVKLDAEKIEQLAINDGFDSSAHFFEWFNDDFEGKIIHFTNYRY